MLISSQVFAQVNSENVNSSKNISTKTEIRYYYFPNLLAYYGIKTDLFIFKRNGDWITSEIMDANYRGYSLNNHFYVAIKDFDGDQPYTKINEHKERYPANFSSKHQPKVVATSY